MQCNDNANQEYFESIIDYIDTNELNANVHLLGVVDRDEQLCIMKNARILLQPSMFEGWGCSVEDAKVMGKTIILSDISVHKEQKNHDSVTFEKHNEEMLAEVLVNKFGIVKAFDFEKGGKALVEDSKKYAVELERVLDNIVKAGGEKYVDRLWRYRKDKILELFGNIDSECIGIYGTGWHTDKIMHYCQLFLEDTNFVFFDSDQSKWGKEYYGSKIHSIDSVYELGIKRIIISSIKYQEEIFNALCGYLDTIEIKKIYETEDEKQERLFF